MAGLTPLLSQKPCSPPTASIGVVHLRACARISPRLAHPFSMRLGVASGQPQEQLQRLRSEVRPSCPGSRDKSWDVDTEPRHPLLWTHFLCP